jgi:hypothetical protein
VTGPRQLTFAFLNNRQSPHCSTCSMLANLLRAVQLLQSSIMITKHIIPCNGTYPWRTPSTLLQKMYLQGIWAFTMRGIYKSENAYKQQCCQGMRMQCWWTEAQKGLPLDQGGCHRAASGRCCPPHLSQLPAAIPCTAQAAEPRTGSPCHDAACAGSPRCQ